MIDIVLVHHKIIRPNPAIKLPNLIAVLQCHGFVKLAQLSQQSPTIGQFLATALLWCCCDNAKVPLLRNA